MSSKTIKVQAPSNIAFVKYWGKKPIQIPMNPSISMTLSKCLTEMEFEYMPSSELNFCGVSELIFEGKNNEAFRKKLDDSLKEKLRDVFPYSNKFSIKIKSKNTFPHSAGIASSASAMSAFSLGLYEIAKREGLIKEDLNLLSEMSRICSGSACRSIYNNYASWGYNPLTDYGSDHYATEYSGFHENFKSVCDSVLIVSASEKSVSSTAGHKLMDHHVFKEARISQALENMRIIKNAMESGDWKLFGEALESEALSLHALMMTSEPSYILLEGNSINIVKKLRELRENDPSLDLYFTIDAGPNIHLIYPKSIEDKVKNLIQTELSDYFESVIHDEIGHGAKVIS